MNIKIRKDFDATKEYSVDVEHCTVKEKKEVQQAFFDVGILWNKHGEAYECLDAVQYSNAYTGGEVANCLMHGNETNDCNMTAEEFLYLVYEPEQVGHVHAELMAQYAEDAKTTTEPWKLWQLEGDDGIWHCCQEHPKWATHLEYRHKPKTKLIHGVEVPVFEFTPKVLERYYTANVGLPELFEDGYRSSEDCTFTERMIERGLLYPCTEEGKQATILHSKAMLGIA